MALSVPSEQIASIRWLFDLPDDKLDAFLDVLSTTGPQFNVFDLSIEISKHLQSPPTAIVAALRVLASLYLTRNFTQPIETFVDRDVFRALEAANAFSNEPELQWQKLRKFLVAALSLEKTLGTAAKSGNVLTQHERIFHSCRVMTDLRPIFHIDVNEKPDAAVIIHMLKITQRDNSGNREDLYFALDHNDVITMQTVLERALKKEKTLKDIVKHSGVAVLDPKLTF